MRTRVMKTKSEAEIAENSEKTVVAPEAAPKGKYKPICEKIAGDSFFYRNWFHENLKKAFPEAHSMWNVDLFFPYAKTGPVAFDQANYINQVDCETLMLKKKHLNAAGIKYILLKPEMGEAEIMEQIA